MVSANKIEILRIAEAVAQEKMIDKSKFKMATKKVKEGTSRGDTTTNLRNFSSRLFFVPTGTLENAIFRRQVPKHDNYRARKPRQLF